MEAIILAAGRGNRLRQFNPDGRPKCLLEFNGQSLLSRQLASLARCEISRVELVVGYEADQIIEHVGKLSERPEVSFSFNPRFLSLITRRRMQQAVSELFAEPAVLFKDKINFKLPGGDGFLEHQDVQAGWDAYASLHITAMVAIDETNAENGSLEMMPGMHREGILGKKWAPLVDADTGGRPYVAVHCKPGDAVFFDSFAPHRSQPNHTDQARRVLYITFNRASEGDHREAYYTDKHRNYPPDIERDPDRNYQFKV